MKVLLYSREKEQCFTAVNSSNKSEQLHFMWGVTLLQHAFGLQAFPTRESVEKLLVEEGIAFEWAN